MCFIHTNTEINTQAHDAYKLICGNNRWWPEKRFYRRWQQCFCSACALYRPCRPPTLMPMLVLGKKNFFETMWNSEAFLTIKRKRALNQVDLSRIKEDKEMVEEKKVYDDRHGILFEKPAECLHKIFSIFLLSRDYYLTAALYLFNN